MLFLILGPSSLPIVVAQPDERHANKTASVLEWHSESDRHKAYNIWFKRRKRRRYSPSKHLAVSIPCHDPDLVQNVVSFVASTSPINKLYPDSTQSKAPRAPETLDSVMINRGKMSLGIGQSKKIL